MDLTALIASLDFWPFTALALFLHDYAYSLVAILSLPTVRYLRKRGRYYALAGAMVLSIALAFWLKGLYAIPRPCNSWLALAKTCPAAWDYGFPSGHAAFAFVFVAASLGTRAFPLYLAIGIIVGFSRIYLGVHSIGDVAGGAVLGIFTYLLCEEFVDWAARKRKRRVA